MARRIGAESGLAAAAILAALTIAVFFALQNYGPESAVRRLHEAFLRKDRAAFAQLLDEPLDDPSVSGVILTLERIAPYADSYRLESMERKVNAARLGVVYLRRSRIIAAAPWWVDRVGSRVWRINATKTVKWMRDYGLL